MKNTLKKWVKNTPRQVNKCAMYGYDLHHWVCWWSIGVDIFLYTKSDVSLVLYLFIYSAYVYCIVVILLKGGQSTAPDPEVDQILEQDEQEGQGSEEEGEEEEEENKEQEDKAEKVLYNSSLLRNLLYYTYVIDC